MTARIISFICAIGLAMQIGTAQITENPFDLRWKSASEVSNDTAAISATDLGTATEAPIEAIPEEVTVEPPPPDPETVEITSAVPDSASAALTSRGEVNPFDLATGRVVAPQEAEPGTADPEPNLPEEADPEEVTESKPAETDIVTTKESAPGEVESLIRSTPKVVSNLVLFLLFGLVLLLLTWAVNINKGFIRKIWRAALNDNLSSLLLREQKFASIQYLYYLVYITFFVNGGIFLYFIARYTGWSDRFSASPLIMFVAFAAGIYLVRHFVMAILGSIFPISRELRHFSFNILLYNILLGIFLIPINLFLAFGPESVRPWCVGVGIVFVALVYLTRQFRGLVIGSNLIAGNLFHFFVYLCTIEILPVLVLFKFLHN